MAATLRRVASSRPLWPRWQPQSHYIVRTALQASPAVSVAVRRMAADMTKEKGKSTQQEAPTFADKLVRFAKKYAGFYVRKQIMLRNATTLYSSCAERAMHPHVMRVCNMPDTFQSWFLVTHLHLWMVMVRLKQEGSDGKYLYKAMVQLFWEDVQNRIKVMGVDDRTVVRESTRELLSMFYGLLFAYDEGLAGHDEVLAAALWRNLFRSSFDSETRVQDVAAMVEYVRKEIRALDDIDANQFFEDGTLEFGSLPEKA